MTFLTTIIFTTLLTSGFAAPVDVKQNPIEKRRDSTKETVELEEALKRLSGENKKFFPPADGKIQPQIDGLDPHSQDEEESQLFKLASAQENSAEPIDIDENENESAEESSDTDNEESINEMKEPEHTGYLEEDNEDNGFWREDADDSADEGESEEVAAQEYPDRYASYGIDPYQDYYADRFGESENRLKAVYPQYADMQYAPSASRGTSRDGYLGTQPETGYGDENQDYLLQNMLRTIQEHPELMGLLEQGRSKMLEEGSDDWDQDELDLDNLGQQPSLDSTRDEVEALGGYPSLSRGSDETQPSEGDAYDALSQQLAMQQTGNSMDDLEKNLQSQAMIQQLETLQELYGDKGAHTVAKKMGFGGLASENHMIPETEDLGSGEVEEENEIDQPSYQENTLDNVAEEWQMRHKQKLQQMSIM